MSASESEPEAGEPSVRFPGTQNSHAASHPSKLRRHADYRRKVSLSGVKNGYTLLCKHFTTVIFIPIAALIAYNLWEALQSGALLELYQDASQRELKLRLVTIVASASVLSLLGYLFFSSKAVYLVNFSCYKPPASAKISHEYFKYLSRVSKRFDDEAMAFQERVIERSGLGDETYLPVAVRMRPPVINMKNARLEAEMVMFGAVADVLAKTGLKPADIGILIVNCSLFNPTPSLAAMIINKFRMPHDVTHFNLSGMGCSAGLIAIDLAAKMLQLHNNQYALVVSTENITQNWYFGNNRSMLLPNCLFRMGASAVVLSNKITEARRAKYRLACPVIRTMTGGKNEAAYQCIYQMEDDDGNKGVKLTRQLMGEAGRALKQNITTLGPLVLPLSEQLLFFCNLIARKVFKAAVKPYIPDFRLAFDYFCIHTGGRAVIEEIEKQLRLRADHVAPSKETLRRFGNTSSSSIWYILANIETKRGVKRGDRIWQIGFGSGFKCNSAVWHAMRNNTESHVAWTDEEMETDPKWFDEATWANAQAEEATTA